MLHDNRHLKTALIRLLCRLLLLLFLFYRDYSLEFYTGTTGFFNLFFGGLAEPMSTNLELFRDLAIAEDF